MIIFRYIVVFVIILNSFFIVGQMGLQVGYDYGVMLLPKTTSSFKVDSRLDDTHRLNINPQFLFQNNFLIAFNLGFDFQNIKFESKRKEEINSGETNLYQANIDAQIQNYRTGLALGYNFKIWESNLLSFKINYDLFFIKKIRLIESTSTHIKYVNNIIDNKNVGFQDYYSSEAVGYPLSYRKTNNHVYLSVQYEHIIESKSIICFFGYSPFESRVFPNSFNRQYFLFGLRLGYTLPQKTKTNEK